VRKIILYNNMMLLLSLLFWNEESTIIEANRNLRGTFCPIKFSVHYTQKVQVTKIQRRSVGNSSRSANFGAECNGVPIVLLQI